MKPVLFTIAFVLLMTACTSKSETVSEPQVLEADTTIVVTDTTAIPVEPVTVQ